MNSLFVPAKCSSTCACSLIAAFLLRLVTARQVTANIHGHDVYQREHKHPDEVDEVPVQATDLDIFVLQFVDARRDYAQIDGARSNVEHVQTGDGKKCRAEQW